MMNLGIYLQSLSANEELEFASIIIKYGIDSGRLSDASIFYDSVGKHSFDIRCGVFNSTDIWNFSGELMTMSLAATEFAIKIINKFNIYYYYTTKHNDDLLALLNVINSYSQLNIICSSDDDAFQLFRLTGKKTIGICKDFNGIINTISEFKNNG